MDIKICPFLPIQELRPGALAVSRAWENGQKGMGKIRVAICDDEQNIRSYLAALIRREDAECEISEYASAEAYLAAGETPDLLLLDIELGDRETETAAPMDGMALAGKLRSLPPDRQPLLIFVTGHERYVYQAFDVEAFQYLVKPVDERRFTEVFRRAVERISLLKRQSQRTLVIQYAGASRVVPLESICYAESQGHKVLLHLREETLEYYGKIGELEQELGGQFARIHKGYLVNLSYVEEYTRGQVTLTGGEKLMISKYKYDDFVKRHLLFLRQ